MRVFWMHWRAFWHGFFHPFSSHKQRVKYAERLADWYWKEKGNSNGRA